MSNSYQSVLKVTCIRNNCHILIFILLLLISCSAQAAESSPFYRLDNNWGLTYGNVSSNGYNAMELGIDVRVLTDNNIWLNIYNQNYSNLQMKDTNSAILNNLASFNLGLKAGYQFIFADNYAVIPNLGFSYTDAQSLVHSDSQPIFNYTMQSYNTSLGLNLEYAPISTLKLELDSSFIFASQNPILPSTNNTISHDHMDNQILNLTPSISWNFYKSLNASIFYQANWLLFNTASNNNDVNSSTFDINSRQISSLLSNSANTIGLKLGMLF